MDVEWVTCVIGAPPPPSHPLNMATAATGRSRILRIMGKRRGIQVKLYWGEVAQWDSQRTDGGWEVVEEE